jgi:transcriptional regulator with XRE-family HTH domain
MPPLRLSAEKVESLRKAKELTMAQAADACGLTKQRWNNIVHGTGQVMLETLGEIARVLGVKPFDLVEDAKGPHTARRRKLAKRKGGAK